MQMNYYYLVSEKNPERERLNHGKMLKHEKHQVK